MIGSLQTASATAGAQIAPVSKTAPTITGILRITSSLRCRPANRSRFNSSATRRSFPAMAEFMPEFDSDGRD